MPLPENSPTPQSNSGMDCQVSCKRFEQLDSDMKQPENKRWKIKLRRIFKIGHFRGF